jgi:DNA polymerase-3 subunit gamma/tau
MSETLYRKYRPQTFAEVAEQEHVIRTMTRQLATNAVAHAYLFSGPRGVGKTTIARLFAKALNCERRCTTPSPFEGEGRCVPRSSEESKSEVGGEVCCFEPCNACHACRDFMEGRMLSCIEIDAASQTGVDNVRENIIENARFAPTQGKYKIFILDEVHMLSSSSFNALLKTLEEPPAHAVFILATTELHKIPATIASRCQRFEFHRVPPSVMIPRLVEIAAKESVTVDDAVLVQIARLSEGCLRDAESLLGQVVALGESHITSDVASLVLPTTNLALVADIVDDVARHEWRSALDRIHACVHDGGSIKHVIEEMLEYVRCVVFAALGDTAQTTYDEKTTERIRAASSMGVDRAQRFLDALLVARGRSSLPALPQIPLEIAILTLRDGENEKQKPHVTTVSHPRAGGDPASTPPVRKYDFAQSPPHVSVQDSAMSYALTSSSDLPFTLEELTDKWERCCAYVAERNIALPLILKGATPHTIEGNTVTVACSYAFHAEALKDPKAKKLLEDAILNVLQKSAIVIPVYHAQEKHDDAVASFVSGLGGSLA